MVMIFEGVDNTGALLGVEAAEAGSESIICLPVLLLAPNPALHGLQLPCAVGDIIEKIACGVGGARNWRDAFAGVVSWNLGALELIEAEDGLKMLVPGTPASRLMVGEAAALVHVGTNEPAEIAVVLVGKVTAVHDVRADGDKSSAAIACGVPWHDFVWGLLPRDLRAVSGRGVG